MLDSVAARSNVCAAVAEATEQRSGVAIEHAALAASAQSRTDDEAELRTQIMWARSMCSDGASCWQLERDAYDKRMQAEAAQRVAEKRLDRQREEIRRLARPDGFRDAQLGHLIGNGILPTGVAVRTS